MKLIALNIIVVTTLILTVSANAQVTYRFGDMTNPFSTAVASDGNLLLTVASDAVNRITPQNAATSVVSDPVAQINRANANESFGINFGVTFGQAYNDPIYNFESSNLQVSSLFQGYTTSGGNESSISSVDTRPPNVLPAPGAVLLTSIGMFCVGWLHKRGRF